MELSFWDLNIAENLAKLENISLNKKHFIVLEILRDFYLTYQQIPIRRVLLKKIQVKLPDFSSVDFHELFPAGLIQAIKIAGLPKPERCYDS